MQPPLLRAAGVFIEYSTRRRQRRLGAACIAVMQAGVFAVLSPADALLDAERYGTPVHVEPPDHRGCPSQHNHLVCQVVRSLVSVTPTGRIAFTDIAATSVFTTDRPSGEVPAKSATFLIGAINPRGPPLA